MTGRFEWHITLRKEDRLIAEATANLCGLSFSEIAGCPILGQGQYCYVTGFDTELDEARARMDAASRLLIQSGTQVLREKIENIVYNTKTGVGV